MDALPILRDALLIVFLALGSVWFLVDLARKLRAPSTPVAPVSPQPTPSAAPAAEPVRATAATPLATLTPAEEVVRSEGIPHAHLAVIAAAVHHLYQGRARVAGVVAERSHHDHVDWAREGRREIFASHRIR